MCCQTVAGRSLYRLLTMTSTKNFKKSLLDFFKRKKKTTFGAAFLAFTVFIENTVSFVQDELELIDKNDREIRAHEIRIKELEQYRASKDIVLEDTVSRVSFNAYISRQDTEYHIQQQKNDEFTDKIGNLTGRVGEIESLTYELNEYALRGKLPYSEGDKK